LDSEVENRMYDIDEILDDQHVISRTQTATLIANMENNQMITPEDTLIGHMEFIKGDKSRIITPQTFQEFLTIYAKYEQKIGGMNSRLHVLIQPWKGTPPRGIQIRWKGEEPFLYDPTENMKKRNKRSLNRSAPLSRSSSKRYKYNTPKDFAKVVATSSNGKSIKLNSTLKRMV